VELLLREGQGWSAVNLAKVEAKAGSRGKISKLVRF
jgi:hypothetical protein